jgi:hypothetical protein
LDRDAPGGEPGGSARRRCDADSVRVLDARFDAMLSGATSVWGAVSLTG